MDSAFAARICEVTCAQKVIRPAWLIDNANMSILKSVFLIGAFVLFGVACMTQPSIPTDPDAEMTYDGLVMVNRSNFETAWVKPDVDLSGYTGLIVVDPEFEFRLAPEDASALTRTIKFPLNEDDKRSLAETVHGAFLQELEKSQYFTLVTEPGLDVLSIQVRLLDIVARMPRESVDPAHPFVSSIGDATLVIEVHDSMSGETLYRAVQRRAARETVGGAEGSRANSWAEIRPAARRWGQVIREQLDRVHNIK